MVRTLVIILLGFSSASFAFTPIDIANHNMDCGQVKLRFGPDAHMVAVNGRILEARWDDNEIEALLGDYNFQVKADGEYELDHQPCAVNETVGGRSGL